MKNNCAFTIVAKNYVGLAKILRESIKKQDPSVSFFIVVADEKCKEYEGEDGVLWAKECLKIDRNDWDDMSFKYNLTEFCTAIKPFCFSYLFEKEGYDKVIYFDPDIYVFSNLSSYYDRLDTCSIILTPHLVTTDSKDSSDKTFLQAGIFNLGFVAMSRKEPSRKILKWWSEKLLNSCFDDVLDYTFTDQKWMNYIPAFLDEKEYFIDRRLGADIAPWNYCEREIVLKDEKPQLVKRRGVPGQLSELIFIHYSGYDYRGMIKGQEHRTRRRSYNEDYDDVLASNKFYTQLLKERSLEITKYLDYKYSYNFYSNGIAVEKFHRRLYRSLSFREQVDNPFDSNSSFYKKLLSIGAFSQTSTSGEALDKDYSSTLSKFNKIMKLTYKLLGYSRYVSLLRLLKHFSRFESQIFLLDSKYNGNSIDILNKI